jgi:hypothetical protein
MARKEQVTCDGCGKLKQETNHWFIVTFEPELSDISVFKRNIKRDEEDEGTAMYDCCGESCVLKKVSELISK